MLSTTRLLALSAVILTAASLGAQSGIRFLGLKTSGALQSQDPNTCSVRRCLPANFPPPVAACAGGTAYDTRTRGTWITNGRVIAKVDSRNQCNYQCPIQLLPLSTVNAYATGLAYFHRANELWVTDSAGSLSIFRINNCQLIPVSRCNPPTPIVNGTLTGIAIDDVGARVFYSYAQCGPIGTALGGMVAVAPIGNPCQPNCIVGVQACPSGLVLRPLTGLAYDACTDQIYATDGLITVYGRISSNCTFIANGCCPKQSPINDQYVGLCIEPSTERPVGQSCSSPSCPNCAPVLFLGSGDPVLGNLGFTVDGANLPANTIAATLFNFGACNNAGLVLPPICGGIHVPLTPTLLAFNLPTGGTVGCTGSTSLPVSIQADPNLCGIVLSSQIIGLCVVPGSPVVGTYVSNCLSYSITAS